MVKQRGLGQSN